jgi:hypothetical protein
MTLRDGINKISELRNSNILVYINTHARFVVLRL